MCGVNVLMQIRVLRARLDNFLKAAASDFDSGSSSSGSSSGAAASSSGSSASTQIQEQQSGTGAFLASTVLAPFNPNQISFSQEY